MMNCVTLDISFGRWLTVDSTTLSCSYGILIIGIKYLVYYSLRQHKKDRLRLVAVTIR